MGCSGGVYAFIFAVRWNAQAYRNRFCSTHTKPSVSNGTDHIGSFTETNNSTAVIPAKAGIHTFHIARVATAIIFLRKRAFPLSRQ
jgi:hypothetical protein